MTAGAQIECVGELRPGPRCGGDIVPGDPGTAVHPDPPGIVVRRRSQDTGKYVVRPALADAEREVRITGTISRRTDGAVVAGLDDKISPLGGVAVRRRIPQ